MTEQQQALLNSLSQYQFATLDLALYLDTHPNDPVALYKHNACCTQYNQLKAAYERMYGPLSLYDCDPSGEWRYINEPWPWNADL